jgi:hypothetical protein
MRKREVEEMWARADDEAHERSAGSFKRALWYGNNSKLFGQNKGARKAIRNAPKMLVLGSLDFTGLAPGLGTLVGTSADILMSKGKDLYSGNIKPLTQQKSQTSQEAL